MPTIKHILVVVDPASEVQHCVEKGAILARAFGAVLELFVCDYQWGLIPRNRLPREVVQEILRDRHALIDKQLHALVAPLRHAGLHVMADYSFHEHLHEGVIRKMRLSGADLVVKDTHYHGAIQRALFTNSDWHMIRECPVPLLLTKPTIWHTRARVAAALDPGHADDKPAELDRKLLDITEQLAAALGGEVRGVHAFDLMPLVTGATSLANGIGSAPVVEIIESLRKFHDAAFRDVLAGRTAFEGRAVMLDGSPARELPAYTEREQIDVLVAGAVSRSPLRRLLVGSTAERLLDQLPCDILVVKPSRNPEEALAAGDR